MSKIDDRTRLLHIKDAATSAISFMDNKTREDLDRGVLMECQRRWHFGRWQIIGRRMGCLLVHRSLLRPITLVKIS